MLVHYAGVAQRLVRQSSTLVMRVELPSPAPNFSSQPYWRNREAFCSKTYTAIMIWCYWFKSNLLSHWMIVAQLIEQNF